MTDTATRAEAIAELIAKVESGKDNSELWRPALGDNGYHAMHAFHGSLDAAKALHDSVLPGCSQYSIVTDPACLCVKVTWWPNGLSGKVERHGHGWSEDNPARAWLLAILRALQAQQEGAKC